MSPDVQSWLGQIPWGPVALVSLVVVFFVVSSANSKKKRAVLAQKIAEGAKVIDVRSQGEFGSGHFAGAINIPVDTLGSRLKSLGALDAPVVVYCASGGRASQAAGILKAAGYTDVTNAGGLGSMPRDS